MTVARIAIVPLVAAVALSLTSCSTPTKMRAYGECTNKIGGGGECKAGFEATWESGGPGGGKKNIITAMLRTAAMLPDAAQYTLDVGGSTIPYPSSGTGTIFLKDAVTGAVRAATSFAWVRSGSIISAQNPDAINDWAYQNANAADTITYEIDRFYSPYGSGLQRIAGNSKYEGLSVTAFSTSFDGGRDCTPYPSPHPCRD